MQQLHSLLFCVFEKVSDLYMFGSSSVEWILAWSKLGTFGDAIDALPEK